MSTQTVAYNNGNNAHIKTDTSKIFVWDNKYQTESYNNSGYSNVTLAAGTVMGRVSATGLIKPLASGASDGSQNPVGILADDYVIEDGVTQNVSICIFGDVVASKLVFDGSDTLDTVISGKRLRDKIMGETMGIKLVGARELTGFDNE